MRHALTEKDLAKMTGRCAVCGPGTPLQKNGPTIRCRNKYREMKRLSDASYRGRNKERIAAYNKQWQDDNREHVRNYRRQQAYGIGTPEYEFMLKKQKGKCAICLGPPRGTGARNGVFHIDHCHNSHRVRGLLCGPCNLMVGYAKDDPALLERAITYLQKESA